MILEHRRSMAIFRCIIQNALRTLFARVFSLAILMVSMGLVANVGAQTIVEKQANPRLVNDQSIPKARLSALHVVGTEETVRLVLDVSRAVDVKSFVLSAPYRFVIDLANTELDLKNNSNNGSPGFLKKVSFGTIDNNLSRLVVEADIPFAIENQFFVPESNGQGKRLVIDLLKSTEEAFRLVVEQQNEERQLAKKEAEQIQQALKQDANGNKTERAAKENQAQPVRKKRIVIDPGHGGKDGGSRTLKGVLEKDIVLSFSKKLAQNLRDTGEFDVIMTREDDVFLRLSERVRIAREYKTDLFVSIHADSFPNDRRVRGTAIYTISEQASDAMAASIAEQQNKSDAIAGHEIINGPDEVVDILFDLTRRETSNLSILFARHFFNSMQTQIRFFKKPLQRASFTVLRVPDIPSVLIELGFLSNAQDAKLLSSDEWREESAVKMAKTIADYFEKPIIGLNQ